MERRKQLLFFLFAAAFVGISQSIDTACLNNYMSDTYHITVAQRTMLEFPRELPGFLVVFITTALMALGDVRTAAIANIMAAVGIISIAFLSPNFNIMVLWLLLYSAGQHIYMPMQNSIAMNLADRDNMGKILGKVNGVNTAAFLVTSIITALLFRQFHIEYRWAFLFGGLAYIGAFLMTLQMPMHKAKAKQKLFLRKEYKLFYVMNVVLGARKQIFLTFGPWVLIKIFGQSVTTFAILGFAIAGLGMFVKPYVGVLIDKKGERFVLLTEAVGMGIVCIGYAVAGNLEKTFSIPHFALVLTCVCFVIDQVLSAAGMARATYLKKIALKPEDVSPTLSMGITMDHFVAMIVPWLGGLVWTFFGYETVFIIGTFIAVMNYILASKIRIQKNDTGAVAEA